MIAIEKLNLRTKEKVKTWKKRGLPIHKKSSFDSLKKTSPQLSFDQEALEKLQKDFLIYQNEKVELFFFRGDFCPEILPTIGRGRALTFSSVGAGSGSDIDLSSEDFYYHHLVLRDRENNCLIGAYRVGYISEILRTQGAEGIYSGKIFEIDPKFYMNEGSSLELSRLFILPSYQKSPLMMNFLWKGLGIVAKKYEVRFLFGSFTISDLFSTKSKAAMVETLKTFHGAPKEFENAVKAKDPFVSDHSCDSVQVFGGRQGMRMLNQRILELEKGVRGLPPLVHYYLLLGAKFFSFKAEPSFNNAIYCFLRVDLEKVPERFKKRFWDQ